MGIVFGWIIEAILNLAFVGFMLKFHEKHPRLADLILAVLVVLMAGILVWAFWLAPA